jgi:hypothetical protein
MASSTPAAWTGPRTVGRNRPLARRSSDASDKLPPHRVAGHSPGAIGFRNAQHIPTPQPSFGHLHLLCPYGRPRSEKVATCDAERTPGAEARLLAGSRRMAFHQ